MSATLVEGLLGFYNLDLNEQGHGFFMGERRDRHAYEGKEDGQSGLPVGLHVAEKRGPHPT